MLLARLEREVMKYRLDAGQIEVVDEKVVEFVRRMTPAQRAARIFALNRRLRLAIEGYVRWRHPEWDDAAVSAEVQRRFHARTR
jgi:hypothetical protein